MLTESTRMDVKLQRIRSGKYTPDDFIIADAKDADMGSGIVGLGPRVGADGFRSRDEFLDQIVSIIDQDEVDIMLVSASLLSRLHKRGAFSGSAVKPAIRANDTTDCWGAIRHGRYGHHPSVPFRTADLSMVMYGTRDIAEGRAVTGTDLGLYSMTFVNDLDRDVHAQNEYTRFRAEAGRLGFRHFLEIFNPNVATGMTDQETAEFVNDCILRCLAGVTSEDRPEFLKMPFNGPRAMDELASFDSDLIVGVLGGGAGTTRDAFELISQAEKYGARLALFGRKINLAELQEQMVKFLRRVVKREVTPEEAVRAYHAELGKLGLTPHRPLEDDMLITEAPLRDS